MSTRYFVSVIRGGEQKVCQYGQSDGYPTLTGRKVLEFVRDMDREQFGQAVDNTKITMFRYEDEVFYDKPIDYEDISKRVWDKKVALNDARGPGEAFIGTYGVLKEMLVAGEITGMEFNVFLSYTKEVGRDILQCLYERPMDKEPLELFVEEAEYNQIQEFALSPNLDGILVGGARGFYVIDLDREVVRMSYEGHVWEYGFDEIPKNIERDMMVREKAIDWMKHTARPLLACKDADGVARQLAEYAENIAISVGVDIKFDHPELMEDGEDVTAEAFGRDFIYGQLMKEYESKRKERGVDGLIAAAEDRVVDALGGSLEQERGIG